MADDPTLLVPEVDRPLTGASVLAMSFVDSEPIDWLHGRQQAERNRGAERLIRLTLQEVFQFVLIQTDPNFASFRYQPGSQRIVLLDSGASRTIPQALTAQLRRLLRAFLSRDRAAQREAMIDIGYFRPEQNGCQCWPLMCWTWEWTMSWLAACSISRPRICRVAGATRAEGRLRR